MRPGPRVTTHIFGSGHAVQPRLCGASLGGPAALWEDDPLKLRDVSERDLEIYIRLRCDPVMMADLGGPQPIEDMPAKVRRDAAQAPADEAWIRMILPNDDDEGPVAGSVALWAHGDADERLTEIGWMVLPDFRGQGLATTAVREVLRLAEADGRWGQVHAFPSAANAASNALCRTLGFELRGEEPFEFREQLLQVNHWVYGPGP